MKRLTIIRKGTQWRPTSPTLRPIPQHNNYSNALSDVHHSLKQGFDPNDYSHVLSDFLEDRSHPLLDQHDEDDPGATLDDFTPEDHQDFQEWAADNYPGGEFHDPPYTMLDHEALHHRPNWLIHFSDHAGDVAQQGFQIGFPYYDHGLHLTTHGRAQSGPGYNFAYRINDRNVDMTERGGGHKYGSGAVVFPATSVQAYHGGDQESQHIFHGPSVDPMHIHEIRMNNGDDGDNEYQNHEGEWKEKPTGRWVVPDATGKIRSSHDSPSEAANWIKDNAEMLGRVKAKVTRSMYRPPRILKAIKMLVITHMSKGVDGDYLNATNTPAARYRPTSGSVWVNKAALKHLSDHFNLRGATAGLTIGKRSAADYLRILKLHQGFQPHLTHDMIPAFQQAINDNPDGITIQPLVSAQHDLPFVRHESVHREQLKLTPNTMARGAVDDALNIEQKEPLRALPMYQKACQSLQDLGYNSNLHAAEITAHIAAGQHGTHLGLSDEEAKAYLRPYVDSLNDLHGPGTARTMFRRAGPLAKQVVNEQEPVDHVVKKGLTITMSKAYLLRRDADGKLQYRDHPASGLGAQDGATPFAVPTTSAPRPAMIQSVNRYAERPVWTAMQGGGYTALSPASYTPLVAGASGFIHHQYTTDEFSPDKWGELHQSLTRRGLENLTLRGTGTGAAIEGHDPATDTRHLIHITPQAISTFPDAPGYRRAQSNMMGRPLAQRAAQQSLRDFNAEAQQGRQAAGQQQRDQSFAAMKRTHERTGPDYTRADEAHAAAGPEGHVYQPDPSVPVYNAYRPKPVGQFVPKPALRVTRQQPNVVPAVPIPAPDEEVPEPEMTTEEAKLDARQQRRANRRAQQDPGSTDIPFRTPRTAGETGQEIADRLPGYNSRASAGARQDAALDPDTDPFSP